MSKPFKCGFAHVSPGFGSSSTQINIIDESIEISHWMRGTTSQEPIKIIYIFNKERVFAKRLSCDGISNPYHIKNIQTNHIIFIKSLFNIVDKLQIIDEGEWFSIIEKISGCFSQYNKLSEDEFLTKIRINKLNMKISELETNTLLENEKKSKSERQLIHQIQWLEERNKTLNIQLTKSKILFHKLIVICLFWIYIFTKDA